VGNISTNSTSRHVVNRTTNKHFKICREEFNKPTLQNTWAEIKKPTLQNMWVTLQQIALQGMWLTEQQAKTSKSVGKSST
jgi:hypothetical protein